MKIEEMTDDQIWEQCIDIHQMIVRKCAERKLSLYTQPLFITSLKIKWYKQHPELPNNSNTYCLFCEKDSEPHVKGATLNIICEHCPGVQIDPAFDCRYSAYDYRTKPYAFLNELKRLNKIRLFNENLNLERDKDDH